MQEAHLEALLVVVAHHADRVQVDWSARIVFLSDSRVCAKEGSQSEGDPALSNVLGNNFVVNRRSMKRLAQFLIRGLADRSLLFHIVQTASRSHFTRLVLQIHVILYAITKSETRVEPSSSISFLNRRPLKPRSRSSISRSASKRVCWSIPSASSSSSAKSALSYWSSSGILR